MNKAGNVFCLLAALLIFAASFPAGVDGKAVGMRGMPTPEFRRPW